MIFAVSFEKSSYLIQGLMLKAKIEDSKGSREITYSLKELVFQKAYSLLECRHGVEKVIAEIASLVDASHFRVD